MKWAGKQLLYPKSNFFHNIVFQELWGGRQVVGTRAVHLPTLADTWSPLGALTLALGARRLILASPLPRQDFSVGVHCSSFLFAVALVGCRRRGLTDAHWYRGVP